MHSHSAHNAEVGHKVVDGYVEKEKDSNLTHYDTVSTSIKKSVTARVISESWNQSDFCS